jgi:hypothetical protein
MNKHFPDPPLAACPVMPLGYFADKVVFAMPSGDARIVCAALLPGLLRLDIFVCAEGQRFLELWRDGRRGLDLEGCARWLVWKCRAAGPWVMGRPQPTLKMRRDGQALPILMTDGEEFEIAPDRLRLFRAGLRWSRADLIASASALGPFERGAFNLTPSAIADYEKGRADLPELQRAIIGEVVRARAWLPVVRGQVGILFKGPLHDR